MNHLLVEYPIQILFRQKMFRQKIFHLYEPIVHQLYAYEAF